ncbi:MAG: nuclease-related domain-containing protein, partial [Nitrososphaerales archaeon]
DHAPYGSTRPGPAPAVTSGEPDTASAPDLGRLDLGVPGRSAQRKHDRLSARREQRCRSKHPLIGGALLSMFGDPQTTRAWADGARGESIVGARLDALARSGVITLHDRRVPRSRANIDHIALAAAGIYVVDAKYRERGRVEERSSGTIFRPGPSQLYVGRRNRTPMVRKMAVQVAHVTRALGDLPEAAAVPIQSVLAFVNADWGFFPSPIKIDEVLVVWPKQLDKVVSRPGPLGPRQLACIAERLCEALVPA